MAKFLILAVCVLIAGVWAEPPPSSYLPPQARNSPSSVYGAPNGGFRSNGKASSFHSQRTGSQSFSYNSLHENQFGGSSMRKAFGPGKSFGNGFNGVSQQSYKAPGQNGANGFRLSQQYGAPSFGGNGNGNGFGASSFVGNGNGVKSSNGFGVSQKYGAPSSGNGYGLSQQYGAPASGNGFGLSQQYGAPASGNGFGYSQQYNAPNFGADRQRLNSGSKFGDSFGFNAPSPKYGVPSPKYGVPFSKMDDDLAEPANYEYTYEVQAAEESGAEFGHQESREDEFARGVYHVLLPDGRTQIVEYEADEEGFRPVIRYEEPAGYAEARGPQGPY